MSFDDIKNYSTHSAWNAVVKQIQKAEPFANRSSFGKKQGLELLKIGYEAGLGETQQGKVAASRP